LKSSPHNFRKLPGEESGKVRAAVIYGKYPERRAGK